MTDRQTDERTDIIVANAASNYVARPITEISMLPLTAYCACPLDIICRRLLGGPLHRQLYCSVSICLSVYPPDMLLHVDEEIVYAVCAPVNNAALRSKVKGQTDVCPLVRVES